MNIGTGHMISGRPDQKPPVGYVDLTPDEMASLPRVARRQLDRRGEARLPLDHPLVARVRARRSAHAQTTTSEGAGGSEPQGTACEHFCAEQVIGDGPDATCMCGRRRWSPQELADAAEHRLLTGLPAAPAPTPDPPITRRTMLALMMVAHSRGMDAGYALGSDPDGADRHHAWRSSGLEAMLDERLSAQSGAASPG